MKIVKKDLVVPHKWQQICLQGLTRYNVIVAPRQHGKTTMMGKIIQTIAYSTKIKNPVINLCSSYKKKIYTLYHSLLTEIFGDHVDYKWSNPDQSCIKLKRQDGGLITINIHGSVPNPKGPTGTASHLNIIDEAGLVSGIYMEESVFPSTAFTEGINIVTGTVEANDYMDLYLKANKKVLQGSPNWFSFIMRLGDDLSMSALGPDRISVIKDQFDFDNPEDARKFRKEYLCDWMAGIQGTPYSAYYLKAVEEGRVCNLPFDPMLKVGTAWDDGRGVTAVWYWQFAQGKFRIIKYQEWHESSLPEICEDIMRWYKSNGAEMGFHVLPHTTAEKTYTERNKLSRRRQIRNIFKNRGYYVPLKKVGNIETKVNNTKNFFKHCIFDETNCFEGLRALQFYSRKFNKATGTFSEGIARSRFAHGGDAFGELAMAYTLGKLDDRIFEQATSPLYRSMFNPLSPY